MSFLILLNSKEPGQPLKVKEYILGEFFGYTASYVHSDSSYSCLFKNKLLLNLYFTLSTHYILVLWTLPLLNSLTLWLMNCCVMLMIVTFHATVNYRLYYGNSISLVRYFYMTVEMSVYQYSLLTLVELINIEWFVFYFTLIFTATFIAIMLRRHTNFSFMQLLLFLVMSILSGVNLTNFIFSNIVNTSSMKVILIVFANTYFLVIWAALFITIYLLEHSLFSNTLNSTAIYASYASGCLLLLHLVRVIAFILNKPYKVNRTIYASSLSDKH